MAFGAGAASSRPQGALPHFEKPSASCWSWDGKPIRPHSHTKSCRLPRASVLLILAARCGCLSAWLLLALSCLTVNPELDSACEHGPKSFLGTLFLTHPKNAEGSSYRSSRSLGNKTRQYGFRSWIHRATADGPGNFEASLQRCLCASGKEALPLSGHRLPAQTSHEISRVYLPGGLGPLSSFDG